MHATPGDPTGYQAVFVLFTIVRSLDCSGEKSSNCPISIIEFSITKIIVGQVPPYSVERERSPRKGRANSMLCSTLPQQNKHPNKFQLWSTHKEKGPDVQLVERKYFRGKPIPCGLSKTAQAPNPSCGYPCLSLHIPRPTAY